MNTVKIPASKLVIDDALIEIRKINPVWVNKYRQAYRAEAAMPPLIVEKGTNRVVSGNHRLTAIIEEYGPDQPVDVVVKKYSSELKVLEDFAKENSSHGQPLDGLARKKLMSALLKNGATPERVASLFSVTVKRIERWGESNVLIVGKGRKQEVAPVKHGVPPEVSKMKKKEYETHVKRDRGVPLAAIASQLIRWLKAGWTLKNDKEIRLFTELRDTLNVYLGTQERG